MTTTPLVVAHRGGSLQYPENSLAAVEAALQLGADVIELDVHASADGVAMLIHDRDLARTHGRAGAVDALAADALSALGVARLDAALDLVAARDIGLCLEFKDGEYRTPEVAAAWLVAQFARFALHERAVANVPAAVAAEVRRRDPAIRLVLDSAWAPQDKTEAEGIAAGLIAAGAAIVEYEHRAVNAAAVAACHARGLAVWAWTANEAADWERLAAAGVDAVLTDDAEGLLRHLGR
jgi:glycerophosphoryl diester phosphodiesterase